MPKRPSKNEDVAEAAFRVAAEATGETVTKRKKNPAAVALGKLGGAKGGHARAAALSPKRRSEIARQAADKRWNGREER
jgi:hypothetical protein